MTRGQFSTTLCWTDADGEEIEAAALVLYSATPGYPATRIDPAFDGEVEIISITPKDPTVIVPSHFDDDEALIAECWADVEAEAAAAAEYRAEARRDDLMMERWERSA
ncbi:MAG: hypothetical protein ACK4ZW_08395 [Blastomonas sp.]